MTDTALNPPRFELGTQARWLLWLLPAILFLMNLGGAPLFDVDEGAFSEATREMFVRHDFLSTFLNGAPRFDKPILIYWCQAIFVWLLGPNEWSFRLPSALAASTWCYAVGVFAWQRFGREAGWLACGIAATSLGVHIIGRAATADALLNMLLTLALLDAWRHLESGQRKPLLRSFLWIGLGGCHDLSVLRQHASLERLAKQRVQSAGLGDSARRDRPLVRCGNCRQRQGLH